MEGGKLIKFPEKNPQSKDKYKTNKQKQQNKTKQQHQQTQPTPQEWVLRLTTHSCSGE